MTPHAMKPPLRPGRSTGGEASRVPFEVETCRRRSSLRSLSLSLSLSRSFPLSLDAFLFSPREKAFQNRYIFHWNFAVSRFRRRGMSVRKSRFVFTLSLLRGELARARTAA